MFYAKMKKIIFVLNIFLFNSIIFAQTDSIPVQFSFQSKSAASVSVVGSFSGWSNSFPMKKDSSGNWSVTLKLPEKYFYYKFIVDGNWIPDPSNPLKVNDGGTSFNSIIKVGNPPTPARRKRKIPFPKEKLPAPIFPSRPDYLNLYYAAWEMAWQKISAGTRRNGFVDAYMDEGFNEMIYQWDTCFMLAFAVYGRTVFPVMQSLDNFYRKQRDDGYIQRVYSEETGLQAGEPTNDEPMVNPPLFAWIELRYAIISGDTTRLPRVLPILIKYFDWMEKNTQSDSIRNLYYNSPLGSGMDNTPRPFVERGGWVDATAQQAFAAKNISAIAKILKDNRTEKYFESKSRQIFFTLQKYNWNKEKRFFFDVSSGGVQNSVKHIGAFWTLLIDSYFPGRFEFINHLRNPKEFWRPHVVPTLSADDPNYNPRGHYWRGGVWAPTNFMVVKGLENQQVFSLADSIAENHLKNMAEIFTLGLSNDESVAYEERYGDRYKTIWECYSPEYSSPATRWDDTFFSRQDFVGWSGLGPIALFIENVLGISVNGMENKVTWRIHQIEEHGIERIQLRDQFISLKTIKTSRGRQILVEAEKPFLLFVNWNNSSYIFDIKKKRETLDITR
jgi:hypothetical protein